MGPLMTEYFRQRLLSWRADLVEESKQTIENLKDEVRDVGDEAERATRETENSLELRTRDRYRKLIGKIDSTLKRRSEEHTSELQSRLHLVCRLLLEKKKKNKSQQN